LALKDAMFSLWNAYPTGATGQEWTFDINAKIVNSRVDPIVLAEEVSLSATIL
jgi:hypothetical protein